MRHCIICSKLGNYNSIRPNSFTKEYCCSECAKRFRKRELEIFKKGLKSSFRPFQGSKRYKIARFDSSSRYNHPVLTLASPARSSEDTLHTPHSPTSSETLSRDRLLTVHSPTSPETFRMGQSGRSTTIPNLFETPDDDHQDMFTRSDGQSSLCCAEQADQLLQKEIEKEEKLRQIMETAEECKNVIKELKGSRKELHNKIREFEGYCNNISQNLQTGKERNGS